MIILQHDDRFLSETYELLEPRNFALASTIKSKSKTTTESNVYATMDLIARVHSKRAVDKSWCSEHLNLGIH